MPDHRVCHFLYPTVIRSIPTSDADTLDCNLVLWVCGKLTFAYEINNSCIIQSIDEPLIVHPDYLLAPLKFSLDDSFNIASESRGENDGDQEVKLEWKNFVTTAPPDENTPSK